MVTHTTSLGSRMTVAGSVSCERTSYNAGLEATWILLGLYSARFCRPILAQLGSKTQARSGATAAISEYFCGPQHDRRFHQPRRKRVGPSQEQEGFTSERRAWEQQSRQVESLPDWPLECEP